jgi:hypothetical protein
VPTALRLDDVLENLYSPREPERERAARQLARLGRLGLTLEQGLRALKASTLPYPPRRYPKDDTSTDLIRAVLQVPYPEYLPQIVQRYRMWNPRAQREALNLLTRIEDARAAEAVVQILGAYARTGNVPRLPLGMNASAPHFPEVFFPALLDYLDLPKLRFAVYEYTLSFAGAQLIDTEMLTPHADRILTSYRQRRDRLMPAQQPTGVGWMWGDGYHRRRWQTGVLLDLLGHVAAPGVEAELRRAVAEYSDPRLKMYAVLSLLRQNFEVDADAVADVAASPECRRWLFDSLQKLERFHLFPAALRTQPALAESDLVHWLLHPAELGRAPDEIELMQVIPFPSGTDDGWLDYYLFRFRTDAPHWSARHDWMAGVSGPFLRKDAPSVQALGDTFSAFTPWRSKPLAEHVADVRELMKTWRERHVPSEE